MEISKYDCPITPNKRRCKVYIEHEDLLGCDWEKYYDTVKRHDDNSYIIVENDDCYLLIMRNGYIDILQASDDEVIDENIKLIKRVIN